MKNNAIISVFNIVSGIHLNKVEDKDLHAWVFKTHMAIYKVVKDIQEDAEEIRKKIFEGHEDEAREYSEKFGRDKGYVPSAEFLSLVDEFSRSMNELYGRESDVKVDPLTVEQVEGLLQSQGKDYSMMDVLSVLDLLK